MLFVEKGGLYAKNKFVKGVKRGGRKCPRFVRTKGAAWRACRVVAKIAGTKGGVTHPACTTGEEGEVKKVEKTNMPSIGGGLVAREAREAKLD